MENIELQKLKNEEKSLLSEYKKIHQKLKDENLLLPEYKNNVMINLENISKENKRLVDKCIKLVNRIYFLRDKIYCSSKK